MKRLVGLLVLVALLAIPSLGFAVGACVLTTKELIPVQGVTQRIYITLTCTGDAGGIAAYDFTPVSHGVRGWYLYNVTTNPGTAPTAAYDITLVSDGEDIAGGLLADRSATATETVVIAPTTKGYHMTDKLISITFANETANPAVIVLTLRFIIN